MKNIFNLNESEKNRIRNLHESSKQSFGTGELILKEQFGMEMVDIQKTMARLTPEQELMVEYLEENYEQFRGEPDENAGDIQWFGSPEPHPTARLINMNGDNLLRIEFDNKRMYIDEDVFYFNQPLFKFKQLVDKNYKIQEPTDKALTDPKLINKI